MVAGAVQFGHVKPSNTDEYRHDITDESCGEINTTCNMMCTTHRNDVLVRDADHLPDRVRGNQLKSDRSGESVSRLDPPVNWQPSAMSSPQTYVVSSLQVDPPRACP